MLTLFKNCNVFDPLPAVEDDLKDWEAIGERVSA